MHYVSSSYRSPLENHVLGGRLTEMYTVVSHSICAGVFVGTFIVGRPGVAIIVHKAVCDEGR